MVLLALLFQKNTFTPDFFLCRSHKEWVNQFAQMIGLLMSPSLKAFEAHSMLKPHRQHIHSVYLLRTSFRHW
jgi:hypothetical protein